MATFDAISEPPARSRAAVPSWLVLIGFVLLCQGAGALGALTTSASWYAELQKPRWAPPPWIFGPVWLTLYTMMGTAAWLVWRQRPSEARTHGLTWFAIQLVLNAAWTPVFFGLQSLVGGLVVIAALDVAALITIVVFGRRSQPAAWLLVPYAAWAGFATALTTSLWLLSR